MVTTLPKPPTAPRAIMSTEKNAAINQTTCNTVSCDEYDAFASLRSSQVYPIATPFADSNDSSATDDYIPVTSVATQSPNLGKLCHLIILYSKMFWHVTKFFITTYSCISFVKCFIILCLIDFISQ